MQKTTGDIKTIKIGVFSDINGDIIYDLLFHLSLRCENGEIMEAEIIEYEETTMLGTYIIDRDDLIHGFGMTENNPYGLQKRRWECLSDIEACKINGERSGLHEILIQAFQEMLEYTEKQGKKHSKNTFDWNRNNIAAFADELVSRKEDLGERIHIIEALQWAQNHSEQIIEVIEGAEDYYDARAKVMETFGFDRIQAQSVTEMRVRTFCEIEKEKLSGELQKFRGKMELFQE